MPLTVNLSRAREQARKRFLERYPSPEKRGATGCSLRFEESRPAEQTCLSIITPRYYPLRPHLVQSQFLRSLLRFNIVPAGRRSGKTEIAKRRMIRKCLKPKYDNFRAVASAPTHAQAKRIYWEDFKRIIPRTMITPGGISNSELMITFKSGASLTLFGMDVPERIEGPPLDHWLGDEFGNMKAEVWTEHVRPALGERGGTADLIGAPEGRNHYWDLWQDALLNDSWGAFTWVSADILPPEEIAELMKDMDDLTFRQELRAEFVSFAGRAYYCYSFEDHVKTTLPYDMKAPLAICLDFNVEPGVAVIAQEHDKCTMAIGEVYIPRDSNSERVARKIADDWGTHKGDVWLYGDSTGGSRGSAKLHGSDWDIIKRVLKPVFGSRLRSRVPRSNPRERIRINSVNTRLRTTDGQIRTCIAKKCKHMIRDLEGVTIREGTNEIDKTSNKKLTHISDAWGYMIHVLHPFGKGLVKTEQY